MQATPGPGLPPLDEWEPVQVSMMQSLALQSPFVAQILGPDGVKQIATFIMSPEAEVASQPGNAGSSDAAAASSSNAAAVASSRKVPAEMCVSGE